MFGNPVPRVLKWVLWPIVLSVPANVKNTTKHTKREHGFEDVPRRNVRQPGSPGFAVVLVPNFCEVQSGLRKHCKTFLPGTVVRNVLRGLWHPCCLCFVGCAPWWTPGGAMQPRIGQSVRRIQGELARPCLWVALSVWLVAFARAAKCLSRLAGAVLLERVVRPLFAGADWWGDLVAGGAGVLAACGSRFFHVAARRQ